MARSDILVSTEWAENNLDADGRLRYRAAGVPKADELRSALGPLLA